MERFKNILRKSVLVYMAITMLMSSLALAPVANAQLGVAVLSDSPEQTLANIEKRINKPLGVALIQILLNLISFVANRLAYDAAIAIASGGKGQTPGYEYRSTEEYGQDLFNDILGESIGELSGTLGDIGVKFDLCAPTDPLKRLNIQLGLAKLTGSATSRPAPKCEFRNIQSNWQGFVSSMTDPERPDQIFKEFATQFTSGGTDLSSTIGIFATTINKAAKEEAIKTDELLANKRFKDVTGAISGHVETPSTVLEDQFKNKLNDAQSNKTDALQGALFGNEGALLQVGVSAGSVFLNTLLSQLTSKVYSGLFQPPTSGGVFNPDFINVSGRDAARETFKDLLSAPIISVDNYNVVNQEFLACPGGSNRGINNCVIGPEFGEIIALAEAGAPMTVQNAIDAGLLHGEWPLISSSDRARNEDAYCYTNGYCYSNIVKLRVARILPVGWELAADKSTVGSPVLLQEVVDGFDNCNTDNPDQPIDNEHKWCHLIDPNWVIKYPESQCRAQVTGSLLLTDNADVRNQTCVDSPSCLEEDENGNCIGGYGYCTRERNAWRFDGDVCPAELASCLTLTSREGDKDSFLTNTVDFAGCDAGNAGCKWYDTAKVADDAGTPDPTDDTFVFDIASSANEYSRQYFNAQVGTCGSGDNGCTELINGTTGLFNPVVNPGFEQDSDNDGVPDGWIFNGPVDYLTTSATSAFGTDAIQFDATATVQMKEPIHLFANQFVTFSYHVRNAQPDVPSALSNVTMQFTDASGNSVTNANLPQLTVTSSSDCQREPLFNLILLSVGTTGTYTRQSCTFSIGNEDLWLSPTLSSTGSYDIQIDGVQIDEREITSQFHTGYLEEDVTNIKVAPEYLGCSGNPTDPVECANFAQVCSSAEVGCTAYTPTNGNPMVPGIVNTNDYCPSECVGYETYRQLETNFSQSVFPTYFIADSASVCTAQNNGCAEFTNLDALAEGGEALEYFTDVRTCQEVAEAAGSNTPGEVFYTWEGSALEGFQLKTWTLKGSNVSDGPCTNFNASNGNCSESGAYTAPAECNAHDDIFTNPDCREFYDGNGTIHFRLFSETVTVDNACSPYRKTVSNQSDCLTSNGDWNSASGNCTYNVLPSESNTCSAQDNGCRGYVGNTGNNTRLVAVEFFEDGTLDTWANGTGGNLAGIYYSNESVATDGHSMEVPQSSTSLTPVLPLAEDDVQDGFEYMISFWAKGTGTLDVGLTDGISQSVSFVGNSAMTATSQMALTIGWQEYTLGPINPVGIDPTFDFAGTPGLILSNGTSSPVFIDNIVLREVQDTAFLIESSWITPSTCNTTPAGATAPQFFLGCQEYSTQKGDQVNLKSFTAICREAAIGCEAFYDTQNSSEEQAQAFGLTCDSPVDSAGLPIATPVSSLTPCQFNNEDVCTILVGQSSCTFSYTGIDQPSEFVGYVSDQSEIIERDRKIFIVDQPDVHCSAAAKGCTELGLPSFDITNEIVESVESVYLLDQPDEYNNTLCASEDLFCEAYSTSEGNQYFFKNPNDQTCEWRDEVLVNGQSLFGWVKTGTDVPCYNDPQYLIGGVEYGIWRNGDNGTDQYDGWVGTCAEKWNTCSEFIDVADNADGVYPDGKPYNFLKNEKLSEVDKPASEKCDGLISQEGGCVAFNDTTIPYANFSASASYIKSQYAHRIAELNKSQFSPITPVNCPLGGEFTVDGQTVDLCANRCAYYGVTSVDSSGSVSEVSIGGSCVQNSDCGTIDDAFGAPSPGSCINVNVPITIFSGICVGGTTAGQACASPSACDTDGGICSSAIPSALKQSLNNDSNTIVKVRRDRSCSEWLACSAGMTAFDSLQNKYVNVCNAVSLCNEFTTNGDNTFCSGWTDQPLEVLDENTYASRDITWYGSEYSGYSIANQHPVEAYTQINVNPASWCQNVTLDTLNSEGEATVFNALSGSWDSGIPQICSSDPDCADFVDENGDAATCETATEDFRLGVNVGPCRATAQNGDTCRVGTCEDSGLSCSTDDQCGGATCALFTVNDKTGVCYNGICSQNIEGNAFDAENTVVQECRAYPEKNSPFPWDIVVATDPRLTTDYLGDDRALSRKSGFNQASLCTNGEDCECSYKKVVYGSGSKTQYLGLDSDTDSGVCVGGNRDGMACDGSLDSCANADAVTGALLSGTGGTCQFKTSENKYIGWKGLCIQRDGSIRLNGSSNADDTACLLWLPVDQLLGGTDIYNKFTEAGFPITNQYYCTETSLLADVYVPQAQLNEQNEVTGITPSCAESLGTGFRAGGHAPPPRCIPPAPGAVGPALNAYTACLEEEWKQNPNDATGPGTAASGAGAECAPLDYDSCWLNVRCPKNHFAVIGACQDHPYDDPLPSTCDENAGDADCPYICVPEGSVRVADGPDDYVAGTTCVPPTPTNTVNQGVVEITGGLTLPDGSEETWTASGYAISWIEPMLDRYKDCVLKGVEATPYDANVGIGGISDDYYLPQWPAIDSPLAFRQWRGFDNQARYYLGCSEIAYTAVESGYGQSSESGNRAFTNRVMSPNTFDPYDLQGGNLGYDTFTGPQYVGRVTANYEFVDGYAAGEAIPNRIKDAAQVDFSAVPVASCVLPGSPSILTVETTGTSCTPPEGAGPLLARSYDKYSVTVPTGVNQVTCTTDGDCPAPSSGPTCDNQTVGNSQAYERYVCFIECSATAIDGNTATNAPGSTDPDDYCGELGLGECVPFNPNATVDDCSGAATGAGCEEPTMICSQYYGKIGTNDPAGSGAASEPAAMGRATNSSTTGACRRAVAAGVIPPVNLYQGSIYWSNQSQFAYQCDGAGAGDAECSENLDCGGTNAQQCYSGICSYTPATDANQVYPTVEVPSSNTDARDLLKQFFGKIYSFWEYNDGAVSSTSDSEEFTERGHYAKIGGGGEAEDITDNLFGDGFGSGPNNGTPSAPVVRGIGQTCLGDNCTEGPDNTISVNGFYNQSFEVEGSFLADVRFFATTDPNHFPIRNVLVDWGDGTNVQNESPADQSSAWGRGSRSGSTTLDNYYKAHRGLDDSDPTNIVPFCTNDAETTEWGLTSESCVAFPFNFVHHYRCTPGLQQWMQVTGRACEYEDGTNRLLNSPCWEDQCVFQPRVYVVDNWEYCTGTCGSDTTGDGVIDDFEACYGADLTCQYNQRPSVSNPNNPWVNYGGQIRVSP